MWQGIQSIFLKLGCDKSSLSEMMGTEGVSETNMMQYLGIIEHRANQLLQVEEEEEEEEDEEDEEEECLH